MPSPAYFDDLQILRRALATLPTNWEGRASVLELKQANYNWKQIEWWAFYFEWLAFSRLGQDFTVPGDRHGSVVFDLKRNLNWDLKSKAIKSDDHRAILNDCSAMDWSIATCSEHGVVVALCDVEYNDVDRSFQRWHTELKGGPSKHELDRQARTSVSRYRKTNAALTEILFLRFDAANVHRLGIMRQGRNANGKPRPEKYMIDLENLSPFLVDRLRL